METKTLQTLLKEKDYRVRGESEVRKLSSALLEFIEQDNKAIWYYDLSEGVGDYLFELYNKGEYPSKSTLRKEWHWAGNWRINEYLQENLDNKLSEEEIKQKLKQDYWVRHCQLRPLTLLENSQKRNKELFGIKNFYGILRDHYNLNPKDRLEIASPTYLFSNENFEENLRKGLKFEENRNKRSKRPIHQRVNKFENFIEKTKEDWFDINKSNYLTRSWKETAKDFFSKQYLWTLSNLPIAYKDTKKAIEFFEKETGVNLSNPKDYRKLIF